MFENYPSTNNEKKQCQNCTAYVMLDSGYGWCRLNPPQWFVGFIKVWKFFRRPVVRCEYPEVEWDRLGCMRHRYREDNRSGSNTHS